MPIDHVCLIVKDIEKQRAFYCRYFGFVSNVLYHNPISGWENYFLSSNCHLTRLELLYHDKVTMNKTSSFETGWQHIAFSLGGKREVDLKTDELKKDGFSILSGPRITGDGYYESSVLDPEENVIELTI